MDLRNVGRLLTQPSTRVFLLGGCEESSRIAPRSRVFVDVYDVCQTGVSGLRTRFADQVAGRPGESDLRAQITGGFSRELPTGAAAERRLLRSPRRVLSSSQNSPYFTGRDPHLLLDSLLSQMKPIKRHVSLLITKIMYKFIVCPIQCPDQSLSSMTTPCRLYRSCTLLALIVPFVLTALQL